MIHQNNLIVMAFEAPCKVRMSGRASVCITIRAMAFETFVILSETLMNVGMSFYRRSVKTKIVTIGAPKKNKE